jgi:hypothetical protein
MRVCGRRRCFGRREFEVEERAGARERFVLEAGV